MARTATKGDDGFWRVSGTDESVYYTDEETAKRVAHHLNNADAVAAAESAETALDVPPGCDVVESG